MLLVNKCCVARLHWTVKRVRDLVPEDMAFGQAALNPGLEDPRDVYYVKSPKSFLGASGLHDVQVSFSKI